MSSGRYLAVDSVGALQQPYHPGSGPNAERWYRVCLADDAALEEDDNYHDGTTNNNDKDATAAARAWRQDHAGAGRRLQNRGPVAARVHVASADVTDGDSRTTT